jgi:hypothetical protein
MQEQVVHHDGVTGAKRVREHLADVAEEVLLVGGPGELAVRAGAVQTHRADHGGGLPVAVRAGRDRPLALARASVGAGHVGFGGCFVDEDQRLRERERVSQTVVMSAVFSYSR